MPQSDPWYLLPAQIIAIPAFLIGLWNLFSQYLVKIKFRIIPEMQIQIMQGSVKDFNQKDKAIAAYNVLFTVIAKGPSVKWNTYKFISSKLSIPDGSTIKFGCRAYIEEKGLGQSNASRNIPISINGGNSKITTAAFQSGDNFKEWIRGKYKVEFEMTDSNNNKIPCRSLEFNLEEHDLKIINAPNSIYMKECF
jgi:hypothetical protein